MKKDNTYSDYPWVSRRRFISAAVGVAMLGPAGLGAIAAPAPLPDGLQQGPNRLPNFLVIISDSLQWRSAFPRELPLPNWDRLQERGVSFSQYHVNTIACGPSRSVMNSGQHIQHTRVYDNPIMTRYPGRVALDPERTPTLNQILPQLGYVVKDSERGPGSGHGLAWSGYINDPVVAEKTAAWLQKEAPAIAEQNPFLSFVQFSNPHDMMFFDATGRNEETRVKKGFIGDMLPAPDAWPYTDKLDYPLPASFDDGLDTKPDAHIAFMQDTNYVHGPIPHEDRDAWQLARNYYYNCTRDMDQQLGKVLDGLEASGLADNTIILFTSDHGEMSTAHGMWQKGPLIYKENLGVPLIISHPDIDGGAQTTSLSCALDLVPTILGLAGMEDSDIAANYPDLKGYNLMPSLVRPDDLGPRNLNADGILFSISSVYECNPDMKYKMLTAEIPEGVQGRDFFSFPEDVIQWDIRSFLRGIYDGRYRYGRYFGPGEHHMPRDWDILRLYNDLELYDTQVDPHEMNNLAFVPEQNKALIMEMNDKLNRLTEQEVGNDDGSYMPGDPSLWDL